MTQHSRFGSAQLCEATCGLTLTIADGRRDRRPRRPRRRVQPGVSSARRARASRSSTTIPTGWRRPLVRRDGELTEATWDEAYAAVAERPR